MRPFTQTITSGSYFLAWHEDRDDDPLIASFRTWIEKALA
jgi:DNA-binding transcriptional LysR family regulator